jgi:hypothetical protein
MSRGLEERTQLGGDGIQLGRAGISHAALLVSEVPLAAVTTGSQYWKAARNGQRRTTAMRIQDTDRF